MANEIKAIKEKGGGIRSSDGDVPQGERDHRWRIGMRKC